MAFADCGDVSDHRQVTHSSTLIPLLSHGLTMRCIQIMFFDSLYRSASSGIISYEVVMSLYNPPQALLDLKF
jgi:hypothetical protein